MVASSGLFIEYKHVLRNQLIWFISGALFFSLPSQPQQQPAQRSLKLHAYLFHGATGELSKDVLTETGFDKDVDFSDVRAVLVTVEVRAGTRTGFVGREQVQFAAVESGNGPLAVDLGVPHRPDRMILNQTRGIGPTGGKDVGYVGFWLEVSGCRSVKLKASIVGAKSAAVTEVLGLTCGGE